MNKKTLHLVYSLPNSKGIYKYIDKLLVKLGLQTTYRNNWKKTIDWTSPIKAPYSISYNLLSVLSKEYYIKLYNIHERVKIILSEDDIFLGHPCPDYKTKKLGTNSWSTFDKKQVTNQVILNYPNDKRVFGIAPFNHSVNQIGWAIPLYKQLHNFIAICGDYWFDNLHKSPFAGCFNNISMLNMAIDTEQYPRLKKNFSPKGKRKFLYIGRVSEEKNIKELEKIATLNPNFIGGYIADGEIKGWNKIADRAVLSTHFVQQYLLEYDFFITLSTYDAQATTILEAMSWGFISVCTPQTGYTLEETYCFDIENTKLNLEKIEVLQFLDEKVLQERIKHQDDLLNNKYSWDIFNNNTKKII